MTIKRSDLTKSQKTGDDIFSEWYEHKNFTSKPILRLGGPAGTGKTFFIHYIKQKYKLNASNCIFASYTGQAVNILRQNGIPAKTLHSTFMEAKEVKLRDENGKVIKRGGIPLTTVRFTPVPFIPGKVKLIIFDETSFLPEDLETLMASYNVPILEMGDPIQLPPVVGRQCFNMDVLDYMFTDPMRQAKDSEILDLATRLRNYDTIKTSKYHDQVLFVKQQSDIVQTFKRYLPFYRHADCIITATNKQRQMCTELYRKHVLNTDSEYPLQGEKVICRKNNWSMCLGDFPLTNGTIGRVMYDVPRSQIDRKAHNFYMDFQPSFISNDYYDNLLCDTDYLNSPFGSDKQFNKFNPGNKFEYAHAITTHLAQGSQFNSVLFMDGYNSNIDYMTRLRYTAVTRAKSYLVYALPR